MKAQAQLQAAYWHAAVEQVTLNCSKHTRHPGRLTCVCRPAQRPESSRCIEIATSGTRRTNCSRKKLSQLLACEQSNLQQLGTPRPHGNAANRKRMSQLNAYPNEANKPFSELYLSGSRLRSCSASW